MKPRIGLRAFVAMLLILGGLFVIFRNVSYTTESRVVKVGDFEATMEERRTVPDWIGIGAIAAGIILLGTRGRITVRPPT